MLPGAPLWRGVVEAVDPATRDGLIGQLGSFLDGLHRLPPETLGWEPPNLDSRERWVAIYGEVRTHLFPAMRLDARADLAREFETFLDAPQTFAYEPAIRHGDPGPGNILFDARSGRIGGVLDFDLAGLGDPAVDWSIVLAPALHGPAFVERFLELHPVSESIMARGEFYRRTWPVCEALRAMKAGETDAFDREMAPFR
jgi:aminoglycoside 2''-phosphotransferase